MKKFFTRVVDAVFIRYGTVATFENSKRVIQEFEKLGQQVIGDCSEPTANWLYYLLACMLQVKHPMASMIKRNKNELGLTLNISPRFKKRNSLVNHIDSMT